MSNHQESDDYLIAEDRELSFQAELVREYNAKNVHQFILHFNVHDYVFTRSISKEGFSPKRLKYYLGDLLRSMGFDVVITYSRSEGLAYLDPETMAHHLNVIPENVRFKSRNYGQNPENLFDRVPAGDESIMAFSYIDRILTYSPPEDEGDKAELPKIALIFEYLENLAPHEDSPHRNPGSDFIVEMLHRWARDRRIQQHIIIGLTEDLGHVASSLYSATSECRAYKVDLPIEEVFVAKGDENPKNERREWLLWVLDHLASDELTDPLAQEGAIDGVEKLANQTSGFNRDNLRDIVYYNAQENQPLTIEYVQQRKREIITAESRELLEFVEPKHNFEFVAGYDYVKEYMLMIKQAIQKQGEDPVLANLVPKGLLFLGPPGTGKSFIAEALAKETEFNMVKLKNIRSMWVGETERNLNRVLDLLTAMSPVLIFIDEVDAALGTRPSGGDGGGSGVEQRIFQRMLEFMAMDENRGKILWIAASNRPDEIDQALISRFDMVMPFLLPNDEARKEMLLEAYPKKIDYTFKNPTAKQMDGIISVTKHFSGRELDTICRRALQLAAEERLKTDAPTTGIGLPVVTAKHLLEALKDFRQAHDPDEYELQTLLAIQATNFCSFLPQGIELPESITTRNKLDEVKLVNRIRELRMLP